jgi:hypothetical protein
MPCRGAITGRIIVAQGCGPTSPPVLPKGGPLSPDYSSGLVVTRFLGSNGLDQGSNRMDAVTANGL